MTKNKIIVVSTLSVVLLFSAVVFAGNLYKNKVGANNCMSGMMYKRGFSGDVNRGDFNNGLMGFVNISSLSTGQQDELKNLLEKHRQQMQELQKNMIGLTGDKLELAKNDMTENWKKQMSEIRKYIPTDKQADFDKFVEQGPKFGENRNLMGNKGEFRKGMMRTNMKGGHGRGDDKGMENERFSKIKNFFKFNKSQSCSTGNWQK